MHTVRAYLLIVEIFGGYNFYFPRIKKKYFGNTFESKVLIFPIYLISIVKQAAKPGVT